MVDVDIIFTVGVCCRCCWFLIIIVSLIVSRDIFFDHLFSKVMRLVLGHGTKTVIEYSLDNTDFCSMIMVV